MRQVIKDFLAAKSKIAMMPIPESAEEVRSLLATESVKALDSRVHRNLYKLLRTFESADALAIESRKIDAMEKANQLKDEEIMRKKADYLLRFVARPLGQQTLLKQNAALQARVAALEKLVGGLPSRPSQIENCVDRHDSDVLNFNVLHERNPRL